MDIVEELLPHMRHVMAADRDLHDLSLLWTMIEAASSISCPEHTDSVLATLSQTRERFTALQHRLVHQLAVENLAELRDELSSTAQCTIDILVRNLFERTADVGFLATDDVIKAFCAASADEQDAQRDALVQRLREYRSKYTVYDDIVVLDGHGRILARLDATRAEMTESADEIVRAALQGQGYVERYGVSDLGDGDRPGLLYAHRIDPGAGRPPCVLVLRFRLSDEMGRIFAGTGEERRQTAVLLIDAQDRVVMSNDDTHVPPGARVRAAAGGEVRLTSFGGREYLSVTCETRGYQGYQGPGLRALAMVSLLVAFNHRHTVDESQGDQIALESQELQQIQHEVNTINRNLRRMVWNGRVASRSAQTNPLQLKAVLQQVNDAGVAMRNRVGRAIGELYRTALGRTRQQSGELARLAADIMDRNLYERANDCRWWALSPVLRQTLAAAPQAQADARLQQVLEYINGLYTVYARLVAFDANGRIRAVTHDDPAAPLLGGEVEAEVRELAMSLTDAQRYAVTPFGATRLSGGESTYVYVAAVQPPQGGRAVGGIAIVFHAAREFRAMLDDVLDGRPGLAAFVDGQGQVISSTEAALPPGSAWPLGLTSHVVEYDGVHYALSVYRTAGYREFKRSDGYHNDVHAVVALRLGAVERRSASLADRSFRPTQVADRQSQREFALFHVGAHLCALPADAVLEALPAERLVRSPHPNPLHAGLLEVGAPTARELIPVACARELMGVRYPAREEDGVVLVMSTPGEGERGGKPLIGLRVDGVSQVLDLDVRLLQELPPGMRRHAPWTAGILRLNQPDGSEYLVQIQDGPALTALFFPQRAQGWGGQLLATVVEDAVAA